VQGKQSVKALARDVKRSGQSIAVRITVDPVALPNSEPMLLVSFEDAETQGATEARLPREGEEAPGPQKDAESTLIPQLQFELQSAREELQGTIEELETANEELKASNEEAMSMNEELQSSNEELETSREELQSLNEELTTVNSQLEDKVASQQPSVEHRHRHHLSRYAVAHPPFHPGGARRSQGHWQRRRPADPACERYGADRRRASGARQVVLRRDGGRNVRLVGPEVIVAAPAAQSLSMAIHELATNAAKYGALSKPSGRVDVSWTSETREGTRLLRIEWRESGGPAVEAPGRRGFGTLMLSTIIPHEMGGNVDLSYGQGGLVCTLLLSARHFSEKRQ
jgi:hypothetical protein